MSDALQVAQSLAEDSFVDDDDDVATVKSASVHEGLRQDLQSFDDAKKLMAVQLGRFKKNVDVAAEYIYQYNDTIETRRVFPAMQPGFMRPNFKVRANDKPHGFSTSMHKFDQYMMPGVCHWKHPYFYAYFPAGGAYGNILGDMLSTGCGGVGFTWASQPALTELECTMMDWLGVALNLPAHFLYRDTQGTAGGGMTTGSASESIHYALLGARHKYLVRNGANATGDDHNDASRESILKRLVAYTSIESHSSVPKAAQVALVYMHLLVPDNADDKITGDIFQNALEVDWGKNLLPFFMCASVGTTGGCAVDDVVDIGEICRRHDIYLHVDAAYAGSAFISNRYAYLRKGLEYADSLDMNPYKFLLGSPDMAVLWVRNLRDYSGAFTATELLNDINDQPWVVNFRSLGIPVTRRMRALKLWALFHNYGRIGLQRYVERLVDCARYFKTLVQSDSRFEVMNTVHLALVCFRQSPMYKRSGPEPPKTFIDKQNINLTNRLNNSLKLHLVGTYLRQQYCLRFSVNYEFCVNEHMDIAWRVIQDNYVTSLDMDTHRASPNELGDILRHNNNYLVTPKQYQQMIETNSLRADGFGRLPIIHDNDTASMFTYFGKQLAKRIEEEAAAMKANASKSDDNDSDDEDEPKTVPAKPKIPSPAAKPKSTPKSKNAGGKGKVPGLTDDDENSYDDD